MSEKVKYCQNCIEYAFMYPENPIGHIINSGNIKVVQHIWICRAGCLGSREMKIAGDSKDYIKGCSKHKFRNPPDNP